MNLHDPQRPRILHRPAFTSGWHAIPRLQLWPQSPDRVELAMMLPIRGEHFMSKWYTTSATPAEIPSLIAQFVLDPEAFVLQFFDVDTTKLDRTLPTPAETVSEHVPQPRGNGTKILAPKSAPALSVIDILSREPTP